MREGFQPTTFPTTISTLHVRVWRLLESPNDGAPERNIQDIELRDWELRENSAPTSAPESKAQFRRKISWRRGWDWKIDEFMLFIALILHRF
jgi:hypothetical protein